jgi:uncharacterized protein YjiK
MANNPLAVKSIREKFQGKSAFRRRRPLLKEKEKLFLSDGSSFYYNSLKKRGLILLFPVK